MLEYGRLYTDETAPGSNDFDGDVYGHRSSPCWTPADFYLVRSTIEPVWSGPVKFER